MPPGGRSCLIAAWPLQAEAALRTHIYEGASSQARPELRPCQSAFELLQQPFAELKVAAYRALSGLVARGWFAADVLQHRDLLAHLLDSRSEAGQLRTWRYGVVREHVPRCRRTRVRVRHK